MEIASVIITFWILAGFRILYGACRNPDWTPEIGAEARRMNNPIRSLGFAIAFVAFCWLGPLLLAFEHVRDMIRENDPKLARWLLIQQREG